MSNPLKFIFVLIVSTVFSSCAKDDTLSLQTKSKDDSKPQVMDVLSGKSNAEVLKMKYKELKATCTLNAIKTTKGQLSRYSSGITPTPPSDSENPISNPSENTLTYDLKLQQLTDQELAKDVKTTLSITKDGYTLNVDITFKPVVFQDSVNLNANKKRYIMKHTPILSYQADHQLLHANDATIVGTTTGRIYEKIEGQKNVIIKNSFDLECNLARIINSENVENAAEFENQWTALDCNAPKNTTEKTICE